MMMNVWFFSRSLPLPGQLVRWFCVISCQNSEGGEGAAVSGLDHCWNTPSLTGYNNLRIHYTSQASNSFAHLFQIRVLFLMTKRVMRSRQSGFIRMLCLLSTAQKCSVRLNVFSLFSRLVFFPKAVESISRRWSWQISLPVHWAGPQVRPRPPLVGFLCDKCLFCCLSFPKQPKQPVLSSG